LTPSTAFSKSLAVGVPAQLAIVPVTSNAIHEVALFILSLKYQRQVLEQQKIILNARPWRLQAGQPHQVALWERMLHD
jgi:hypothetical protein